MSGDGDFVAYLLELLQPLGRFSARRMFGGHGLYGDGLMFAIVFDGRLFLKVDDDNRTRFAAAGCEPFVYESKSQTIEMSYWTVPESALESSEDMAPWARLALAAAQRKAAAKPVPRKSAPKKATNKASKKTTKNRSS
jgi:DNA transformation protein